MKNARMVEEALEKSDLYFKVEEEGVGVTRMGVASYHPIATMPESTPAA